MERDPERRRQMGAHFAPEVPDVRELALDLSRQVITTAPSVSRARSEDSQYPAIAPKTLSRVLSLRATWPAVKSCFLLLLKCTSCSSVVP